MLFVTTSLQIKPNKVADITPKQTQIRTREPQLLTLDESMSTQYTDAYLDNIRPTVEVPRSTSTFDEYGIIARQSPIAGFVLKVVTQSMCHKVLLLAHHSTLAGHPGDRRMNGSVQKKHHCHSLSTDVYNTERHYQVFPEMKKS